MIDISMGIKYSYVVGTETQYYVEKPYNALRQRLGLPLWEALTDDQKKEWAAFYVACVVENDRLQRPTEKW